MEWFRFYTGALDDPKVQRLEPCLFKHWVNLLCLAGKAEPRGVLPSLEDIAFGLRIGPDEAARVVGLLVAKGLLDEVDGALVPHNWNGRQRASDDVAKRVRAHRERSSKHVTLQVTESTRSIARAEENRTETDTEQTSSSSSYIPRARAKDDDGDDDDDDKSDERTTEFVPTYPHVLGKSWPVALDHVAALFPGDLTPQRVAALLGDVERDVGPLSKQQLQAGIGAAVQTLKRANGTITHVRPYVATVITERLKEAAHAPNP